MDEKRFFNCKICNEIIENDYKELNGKEIDIYLPDLKLGFEFDGTYWHADPRFYKENDIIEHKKKLRQAKFGNADK